jgi:hypothetical protein
MTITAPPHRGCRRGSSVLLVGRVLCARSCSGAGVRGCLCRVCCLWRRVCVPVYEGAGWLSAGGGVCARAAGGVVGTLGDSGAAVSACGRWCEACVCGGGVCVRGGEGAPSQPSRICPPHPHIISMEAAMDPAGVPSYTLLEKMTEKMGASRACHAKPDN